MYIIYTTKDMYSDKDAKYVAGRYNSMLTMSRDASFAKRYRTIKGASLASRRYMNKYGWTNAHVVKEVTQ
jgi:hypothetical protein